MRLKTLLFPFLFSLAASAQQQAHRESVTIEVVDVPVYVRSGNEPVRDLTRDDFELFVNGTKHPIEYFDVTGDADSERVTPENQPAILRERRMFLLLFDLAMTKPYLINRSREAAAKFVAGAGPRDYIGVATYSGTHGVRYTLPFSTDHTLVQQALRQLTRRATYDPLSLVAPTPSAPAEGTALAMDNGDDFEETHSRDVSREPTKEAALTPLGMKDAEKASGRNVIEGQLTGLAAVAGDLARLPGQKHVIVVSEGFDLSAMNGFHPFSAAPGLYMVNLLESLFGYYHAAGVFLHTLDPYGLRPIGAGNESLSMMASGTGGQNINDRNDLHDALADLTSTYSHGYILGFRPTKTMRGQNDIVVKVKRRGVAVMHRKGFASEVPSSELNGLYLADIVLNDVPQTGIAATMEIRSGRVSALVPVKQIAAQLNGTGTAELMVYLFDGNGQPLDYRTRTIEIKPDGNDMERIDLQLGLKQGKYALKTLLRVGDSLGFTRANLMVGAPRAGRSDSPGAAAAPVVPRP